MNYSKKGIEYKKNQIKSTSRRMVSKARITSYRLLLIAIIYLAIVGSFAAFGFAKGLIDSAPDITDINVVPQGFATELRDIDGNVTQTLVGAESNRVYVTIDEIPKMVRNSFICIEDERFYEHDGIDVRGIFRAFVNGLVKRDFDQGASTITQQLLKNQVFNGGREQEFVDRLKRKLQEQYLAIQLENLVDKDKILEYYLNTINLGSGTYGVRTASRKYFNKDVSELTLSESAVIAAIAQLPVYHNPITYPNRNKERRDDILSKMLNQGYCSQQEYDEAMADNVYERIQTLHEETDETSYYSYFVDKVIDDVMEDLQNELGMTQTQAADLLYSRGLTICTTQNPSIQKIVDEVYADESLFPAMGESYWELTYALSIEKADGTTVHLHGNDLLKYYKDYPDAEGLYVDDGSSKFSLLFLDKEDMQAKIDAFREEMVEEGDKILGEKAIFTIQPQSSFVVMDQATGYVQAIIGGRGEKLGNRTLNRATNTVRQPGSTFKVLSTYLPAFDTAGLTLSSVQDDAPYKYPGTEKEVSNWNSNKVYQGLSTLRSAIVDSMNIVTVKSLEQVTPQVGYDYLLKLGFTSLVSSRSTDDGRVVSDINLPLALGGITDGVSNLELTAAYAAVANGGIYCEPIFYTKILDHNGKVLIDKTSKKEQVMKESTAFLLTNAMEDVVKVGTGTACKITTVNMPVAGKTGTTSDYNDLWFSGYTPYYTATIWSGFDNNRSQKNRSYQKDVWRTIMERIHSELELETKSFTMPDSIITAKICTKSGKLAVEGLCDEYLGGNTTKVEYFAKGTVPTEKCDVHIRATICKESNALATEYCPPKKLKEGVFLIKTETDKTNDTPYILPVGANANCPIHGHTDLPVEEPDEDTDLDPSLPPFLPPEDEDTDIPTEGTTTDGYQFRFY